MTSILPTCRMQPPSRGQVFAARAPTAGQVAAGRGMRACRPDSGVGLAAALRWHAGRLAYQAPASSCGVSDEPAFATTKEHPVQVGGGAMYVASRERRYLDALRGPMGEPVQYKRTGSLRPERDGRTILDTYEITYPGLDKPITFYFDGYHFDDALKAPKGFTCAVPDRAERATPGRAARGGKPAAAGDRTGRHQRHRADLPGR